MDTIEFDKKVKCGPEYVALRIIENCDELKSGNIWLMDMTDANARLAHCVIEDVGVKASEEYGIKAGDYVMIDRLSTFAHTAPVCLCRYNNVICLTDKERKEFRPLRNMVFVDQEKPDASVVKGVWVPSGYGDKLNIGTVTAINCDADFNLPFKEGDKVLLAKGGDVMELGDRKVWIYKHDMLVCRIDD